jgi:hypothetical protein
MAIAIGHLIALLLPTRGNKKSATYPIRQARSG